MTAETLTSSSRRRKFIITLAVLQLAIALMLTGYTVYMQYTFRQLLKWEEMVNVRSLLRNTAEIIDTQRDTIDRIGIHLPEYGESLAKSASALDAVVPTFNSILKILSFQPSAIPLVGQMLAKNIEQIRKLNQELAQALPVITRDLYYTSEVLGDWDAEHNARVVAALDGIVMSLRANADMLEEQWQYAHNVTDAMSAIGYLVALAIALNAVSGLARR